VEMGKGEVGGASTTTPPYLLILKQVVMERDTGKGYGKGYPRTSKVSPGPAMPNPFTPFGRATP
jgi:hypothetical protein